MRIMKFHIYDESEMPEQAIEYNIPEKVKLHIVSLCEHIYFT